MSFFSPSSFPANDCCFACVSLHIPVLPFPLALRSIACTSRFIPHFPFQNPSPGPPPARFLSYPSTLSSHVFPFPPAFPYSVLCIFVAHFPSQNPVEHARFESRLQCTSSLLPFSPVLPCIVSNTFFFPLFYTWIFLKILFIIDDLLFFIDSVLVYQCCSFCFEFEASAVSVCILLEFS